ncbi:hypothetical protein M8009_13140 [Halomonas sp. ATCH28]|uniref:DUF4468 domain-containing protein n=1 Tax=Halomonas gemina TaxID=2945105 RepID=A0ABT0T2W4_9GAMM|nr:hypothetical protein [Halomonas gemina]MCL7941232.1 hypothetical protein [Halomonas gemina]
MGKGKFFSNKKTTRVIGAISLSVPIAVFLSNPAYAQINLLNSNESLGLIHSASIEVFDDVTGGCWTNAEAIKQKARLTLEQSGVSVYLEELSENYPYSASIYIEAFGKRSESSVCFGSIEVAIGDTSSRSIGETYLLGSIYFYRDRSVAMGRSLNEPFSKSVEESINKLAAEIISKRRNEDVKQLIDQHEEELKAEPETRDEWEERMNIDLPNS